VYDALGLSQTISNEGGGLGGHSGLYKVRGNPEIEKISDGKHSRQRVYSPYGISPTILSGKSGGGQEPSKIVHNAVTQGVQLRELTEDESQGYRVYDALGLSVTIAGQAGGVGAKTGLYKIPEKDLKHVNDPNHNSDRLYIPESISPALRENNDGVPKLWESALIHSRGLETKKGQHVSHAVKGANGGSSRNHLVRGWNTTTDSQSYAVDASYHKGLGPSMVGSGRRTQIVEKKSWKPLKRQRTEKAKKIRRINKKKNGVDYSPFGEFTLTRDDDRETFHTISATPEKNHALADENEERIRRLTPRECYRLQGFPDDYKIKCSDTQAYSQAGNAVTTSVILAIAEELEAIINE
jgi:DNA (cytosine-5)-methyltransferase 1